MSSENEIDDFGTAIQLEATDAVTYEDDDGQLRRRYWQGGLLIDEVVEA